ncbi:chemotaxis protein CheB [Dyadobacter sandarakinus]|uniref:protein-glutamate methylesterase n=1 Tax=Dyadobacter sandarakinus TaxID=2747268 RepID=A0ABX7I3Y6_9BACT|nr:chemotaxis protein CheB [Dyadobacter sandarakinus]QRQ99942.1 chemotaxis protein CheB [Dyadobacter sandarakinus]
MEENSVRKTVDLFLIGGSAGSLQVLFSLVPQLSASLSFAMVIVLHRGNFSDSSLSDLLSSKTPLPVREVEDKDPVQPGNIYLAPADYHLLIERERTFSLDYSEKINFSRPSIDVTFESAAEIYKSSLAGLLLSGANDDGTKGLGKIKSAGGITIVQDPETAQMPFMPHHAIHHTLVDHVLNVREMAGFINALHGG